MLLTVLFPTSLLLLHFYSHAWSTDQADFLMVFTLACYLTRAGSVVCHGPLGQHRDSSEQLHPLSGS